MQYPTSCVVVCIALGVEVDLRGSLPALIYPGGQVYMEGPSRVQLSPTTVRSGSLLCTAASPTPIWVVTREVRYIHELSFTLEYSMSISSPAVPGLT